MRAAALIRSMALSGREAVGDVAVEFRRAYRVGDVRHFMQAAPRKAQAAQDRRWCPPPRAPRPALSGSAVPAPRPLDVLAVFVQRMRRMAAAGLSILPASIAPFRQRRPWCDPMMRPLVLRCSGVRLQALLELRCHVHQHRQVLECLGKSPVVAPGHGSSFALARARQVHCAGSSASASTFWLPRTALVAASRFCEAVVLAICAARPLLSTRASRNSFVCDELVAALDGLLR